MKTVPLALVALAACSGASQARRSQPEVSTSDVHHFVAAFSRLSPADTSCASLAAYLQQESRGLAAYRHKFNVTQHDLCLAIRRSPARYAALADKLGPLDSAAVMVRTVFAHFAALHSMTTVPAVYFVVGNGISGGTTTRGKHPIILIGMELNHSVNGLPWTIAHEMVHTQQDYPWLGSLTGGPKFLRGTLLRQSIMEGSADFIAELITGQPKRNRYAESHEGELWRQFRRDAGSKDYSQWLYNGWNARALGDRPADLGYWMGYRITKSYYEQAADKRQAIEDILTIRDFDRFLAASGYTGGQPLAPSA